MSPEDMQRFEVEPIGAYGYDARLVVYCPRCTWESGPDYNETETLAELVQRAEEHGEVCR